MAVDLPAVAALASLVLPLPASSSLPPAEAAAAASVDATKAEGRVELTSPLAWTVTRRWVDRSVCNCFLQAGWVVLTYGTED